MIRTKAVSMRAAAVAAIGFLIAASGLTAASATTPTSVKSSVAPLCVPVPGVDYQPAVGEPTIQVSNNDYVAAVDEVSHQEYQYKKYSWDWKRDVDRDDRTDSNVGDNRYGDWDYVNHSGTGWTTEVKSTDPYKSDRDWYKWAKVDQKKVTTITAVPGHPETFHTEDNPAYVPAVEAVEAVVCQWYTWDTGTYTPNAQNANDVGWPQTLVGEGQLTPEKCGTTYQQDLYRGTPSAIGLVVDDGTLTGPNPPEDHLIVVAWHFASSDACPPPLKEVRPAVPSAADPPQCGPNNDQIDIPKTLGVDYADTGWVDGARTITATAQSGYTLIGEITSWTFYDAATKCPFEVEAVSASVVDPPVCGPNNDVLTIPTTVGVTYSDTGWINNSRTITATADEGYVLLGQSTWTFTDQVTPCEATPEVPTVVPKCFPNNDTVTIPEVEGVIYSDTGWVDGERTISATAAEGYVLTTEEASWTFVDDPSAGCPTVGPVFAGDELAFTGPSGDPGGMAGLAIFLLSTGGFLMVRRMRT